VNSDAPRVGPSLSDDPVLNQLLNNYRIIRLKLISYIHPRSRGPFVRDLAAYLAVRVQNHAILSYEQRFFSPGFDGSLMPRLEQRLDRSCHRIEFCNEESLKTVLEHEINESSTCPFRFTMTNDSIPILISALFRLGAADPNGAVLAEEEVGLEMNSIQQFVDQHRHRIYGRLPPGSESPSLVKDARKGAVVSPGPSGASSGIAVPAGPSRGSNRNRLPGVRSPRWRSSPLRVMGDAANSA